MPAEDETPEAYTEKRNEADTRYRVSLAEGVTSWQVVEALNGFEALSGEVTEIPAEGYRWRRTAMMSLPGRTGTKSFRRCRRKQQLRINAAWESRQDGLPLQSPEEMLILASIIEKGNRCPG